MTYLASAVMSSNVISIPENLTIQSAEALMKTKNIRHLPVVNSLNELSGIISVHDFGKSPDKSESVKTVMSTKVKMVTRSTDIKSVILCMLKNKISSLLVANNDNIVGIVTSHDLLKLLIEILEENDDLEKMEIGSFFDESWSSVR